MNDSDILSLLVIGVCLVFSMFFSGSETAITSYDVWRAERVKNEGGRDGRVIATWVDRPVWVLSTILLGNNIFNTMLGATATAFAIRIFEGGPHQSWSVPIAVVVSTALLLVFGEIVPKAIGRLYSNTIAIPVLRMLDVFGRLTYPVTAALAGVTEWVLRRATPEADGSTDVTTGELDFLVRKGWKEGSIPTDQAVLLRKVFSFEGKHVREIMVPISRVTMVEIGAPVEEIREAARTSGHSRLPVYSGTHDDIRGILHIKQLVGGALDEDGGAALSEILRRPMFVSESIRVVDLLKRFKEQRLHLAIVVDDAGHTVGVVTLEDVLEQIVGQIFDETDDATSTSTSGPNEVSDLFHGQDSLVKVQERFRLDEDELEGLEGVESVGDFLTRLAGEMPRVGSVFVAHELRFKVLAADEKKITTVRIEAVDAGEDED
ncbi:MAG: hemolysin family protein [Nannocystaceae bacterium]